MLGAHIRLVTPPENPCLLGRQFRVVGYFEIGFGRLRKYINSLNICTGNESAAATVQGNAIPTPIAIVQPSSPGASRWKVSTRKSDPQPITKTTGIHQALAACGKMDRPRSSNIVHLILSCRGAADTRLALSNPALRLRAVLPNWIDPLRTGN